MEPVNLKKKSSSLTKSLLAHNFEKAQELLNEGVPFSTGTSFQMIFQKNYEAFAFAIEKGVPIGKHDVFMIFTDDLNGNEDKFKDLIISLKDKDEDLKKIFSDSEFYFKQVSENLMLKSNRGSKLALCLDETSGFYDLNMPMKEVMSMKLAIDHESKIIDGFIELKKLLPKLSDEQELQVFEWKYAVDSIKDAYVSYIAARIEKKEELSVILEQRNKLNNQIEKIIKEQNKEFSISQNEDISKKITSIRKSAKADQNIISAPKI